ncbi:MAG: hypothetical protein R2861_02990 [Desulfobacterales bacterium]
MEIKVPPLRERKSDIRALAQHFLDKFSRESGKEITKFPPMPWICCKNTISPVISGNLKNLIERSVALSSTNIILPDSLSLSIHKRRWIEGSKTGAMMWMMWKKGRSGHDIRRN